MAISFVADSMHFSIPGNGIQWKEDGEYSMIFNIIFFTGRSVSSCQFITLVFVFFDLNHI